MFTCYVWYYANVVFITRKFLKFMSPCSSDELIEFWLTPEKTEHKNIPPSQDVPKKTDNSNLHCPSNDVPVSNYEILYKACSLELLKSKKHLMISVQAFDAMTFLVNYCANKVGIISLIKT